jgi:citrate lyase subunit beta/citryl-CoA lyase
MTLRNLVTLLFVPGHRESMLAKAPTLPADAIVFDLEDSVPEAERARARELVNAALTSWPAASADQPFVRINAPALGMLELDAEAIPPASNAGVLIPKVDRPAELDVLASLPGLRGRALLVSIETPRSLFHVEGFADHPAVGGLFLGSEDLTQALGVRRTAEGAELALPRLLVVAAARAAGKAAFDSICPEFRDLDVLRRDAVTGADAGFDGKFAIHPAQLPIIVDAFMPSAEDLDRAERVVQAFDEAVGHGRAAVAVDGQMVDPPVAERARALLARASRRR